MGCMFSHDGETCMRYIQTYVDLTSENILRGLFEESFFCGAIMQMCELPYDHMPLQTELSKLRQNYRYKNEAGKSFADVYYEDTIRGNENNLQNYKILQLSDLNIDLKYREGAPTDCREYRCCHMLAHEVSSANSDTSGPFGDKNCDLPLSAAKAMLKKIKAQVMLDYSEINMVVVTGNVVTYQPGQLDADDVSKTVADVYKMIQEVFQESFIFPVFGGTDTYPDSFYPFNEKQSSNSWKPSMPKRE